MRIIDRTTTLQPARLALDAAGRGAAKLAANLTGRSAARWSPALRRPIGGAARMSLRMSRSLRRLLRTRVNSRPRRFLLRPAMVFFRRRPAALELSSTLSRDAAPSPALSAAVAAKRRPELGRRGSLSTPLELARTLVMRREPARVGAWRLADAAASRIDARTAPRASMGGGSDASLRAARQENGRHWDFARFEFNPRMGRESFQGISQASGLGSRRAAPSTLPGSVTRARELSFVTARRVASFPEVAARFAPNGPAISMEFGRMRSANASLMHRQTPALHSQQMWRMARRASLDAEPRSRAVHRDRFLDRASVPIARALGGVRGSFGNFGASPRRRGLEDGIASRSRGVSGAGSIARHGVFAFSGSLGMARLGRTSPARADRSMASPASRNFRERSASKAAERTGSAAVWARGLARMARPGAGVSFIALKLTPGAPLVRKRGFMGALRSRGSVAADVFEPALFAIHDPQRPDALRESRRSESARMVRLGEWNPPAFLTRRAASETFLSGGKRRAASGAPSVGASPSPWERTPRRSFGRFLTFFAARRDAWKPSAPSAVAMRRRTDERFAPRTPLAVRAVHALERTPLALVAAHAVERASPAPFALGFARRPAPVAAEGNADPEALRADPQMLRADLRRRGGGGEALGPELRSRLARFVGADPGAARLHRGAVASEAARRLRAEAFTIGQDVFFGDGRFDPSSARGLGLIAHELTHVRQQSASSAQLRFWTPQGGDAMEREAQEAAAAAHREAQQADAKSEAEGAAGGPSRGLPIMRELPSPKPSMAFALPAPAPAPGLPEPSRTATEERGGKATPNTAQPDARAVANRVYDLMRQEVIQGRMRGL